MNEHPRDGAALAPVLEPVEPEGTAPLGFARDPKDLPKALRPREKLYAKGARWLAHAELIALVLGSGTRSEPVSKVAERLVRRHGLMGLARLKPDEWRSERGLGGASAARLAAAFELGRRAHGREGAEERPKVSRPAEVFARVRDVSKARKEHLVGLYLDSQNGLLHQEVLSIGSLNTTRTHPREILFPAIAHLALGFILVHNHPSGSLEPSSEDLEFTRSVQRAGELMGIELYDHLIVAKGGYTSLREMGLL